MSRFRRLLTGLLIFCAVFSLCAVDSLAAEEPYTYRITFYAGNQGNFVSTDGLSVPEGAKTESAGSKITVSGLRAGDLVSFNNIQGGAVELGKDSLYYVRGLRKSGYDNNEVGTSAFLVEQDQDYVVAYGIKGEMVSYVIRYEDASGNTLAPSRTYYGNVGDRPVVAFLYIAGWQPQAYNLTRTLSANEAENVFTFVYTRVTSPSGTAGGGTSVDGGTDISGNGADGTAAGTGAGTAAGGGQAVGAGTAAGAEGADASLPDEDVPTDEAPRELIDLDDEETPLSDFPGIGDTAKAGFVYGLPVVASISLVIVLLIVVLAVHRYRIAHKKSS